MSSRPASHRVPHGPTRVSSPIILRRRTDDIFPEDDPAGVGLGLRGRVTAREGQGEGRRGVRVRRAHQIRGGALSGEAHKDFNEACRHRTEDNSRVEVRVFVRLFAIWTRQPLLHVTTPPLISLPCALAARDVWGAVHRLFL